MQVRVFIFLLSGLFCCLGFSGLFFFAVWSGACFFFCCLGGGPGPAQTAKKITRPRPNSKKKTRPRPFRACFFFAVWAGGCVCFLLFGPGSVFFFLLLGGGRVLFFAVWAGVVFFFAVWAGGVFFFLLFGPGGVFFFLLFGRRRVFFVCCLGRGRVFFFAVWAGDGSSLTYRSAWLVFKRPNNKKDQTAKKKHGFRECASTAYIKSIASFAFRLFRTSNNQHELLTENEQP